MAASRRVSPEQSLPTGITRLHLSRQAQPQLHLRPWDLDLGRVCVLLTSPHCLRDSVLQRHRICRGDVYFHTASSFLNLVPRWDTSTQGRYPGRLANDVTSRSGSFESL